ncbi:hypothetical protein [Nocardiopsis ansamitocini]|uniref:Uncharacterized protein n=1 Tax=Nocardiopsis ansamitocini TaxID=1670832 RepID=A0A9W6P577_9ACTN|nr:hypothetical protein [Nocardiopsis ansamitocini]GLU47590.1 hypothetical protein Nans01_19410 [Nocardiopsis ansamitocini]
MGRHGNDDKPEDSGKGGDWQSDGQDDSKHGSGEPVEPQSGDGQEPR